MIRARAIGVVVCWAALGSLAEAGEPMIERIFGPEVPTGPYKHPACLAELENGDLYLAYYGGEGEYETDTAVFGSRKAKGSSTWTPPRIIAKDPFRSVGNPVIWQAPEGNVWLFYVLRMGDVWSTSRILAKVSNDQAQTWSDPSILALDPGMMVRNRPLVLSTGAYLLPVYHERGDDTEAVGAESTSLFLRYDPSAKKPEWVPTGRIVHPKGNVQPAPVEIEPGRLVAYCRRGGDYKPETIGYLVRAESTDGGQTWSPGRDSSFPNPNAAVDFLKLRSGNLLLVYNDSMKDRTPLSVALSEDGDKSYAYKRDVATGANSFAYPIALQGKDGTIHVVYTSNRRSTIHHATFDEAWVKEGKLAEPIRP